MIRSSIGVKKRAKKHTCTVRVAYELSFKPGRKSRLTPCHQARDWKNTAQLRLVLPGRARRQACGAWVAPAMPDDTNAAGVFALRAAIAYSER
jgi:hypothetical protein